MHLHPAERHCKSAGTHDPHLGHSVAECDSCAGPPTIHRQMAAGSPQREGGAPASCQRPHAVPVCWRSCTARYMTLVAAELAAHEGCACFKGRNLPLSSGCMVGVVLHAEPLSIAVTLQTADTPPHAAAPPAPAPAANGGDAWRSSGRPTGEAFGPRRAADGKEAPPRGDRAGALRPSESREPAPPRSGGSYRAPNRPQQAEGRPRENSSRW